MSDYDRNISGQSYAGGNPPGGAPRRGWSSGSWIAGAVIVVLVLLAMGYVFNYSPSSGLIEQRAAAPDTTQTTAPMTPAPGVAPAPSPSAAMKP